MRLATLLWPLLAWTCATSALAQKTPDEALAALKAGNQRFVQERSIPQPLGEGVRRTLARGQNPFAIVLTCSDSRVPPEHVFNAGLGELFVVRVAGNTVDAETLASIEYAAEHLGATLCVVLGHESCGAIAACAQQVAAANDGKAVPAPSEALQQLLEQLEPAVRKAQRQDLTGKELQTRAEEENAQGTAQDCLRRSPLLRRLQQAQRFQILPARYHLATGQVEWLPPRPLPVPAEQASAQAHTAPQNMPPHVALRLLQAGHRRFLSDGKPTADLTQKRRESLTQGQQPLAIVVTCADSRVAPEHLFDAGLGELFVVRVAGNAIDDDGLASIEYAAAHTGASLLVVLGHTRCGAVTAAAESPDDPHHSANLHTLLQRLAPSVERARGTGAAGKDLVELAIRNNALRAVADARSRSHILHSLEGEGKFAMLAAVYDLASGDIEWLKDTGHGPDVSMPAAAPMGETGHGGGHGDDHGNHDRPDAEAHGRPAPAGGHAGHGGPAPTSDQHGKPKDHDAGHDDMAWLADQPTDDHAGHAGATKAPTRRTGHDDAHGAHGTSGHDAHDDAHGTADTHGKANATAPGGHGGDDSHGHDGHDAHDAHDAHGNAAKGGLDPVLVIGGVGITSLLLAAVMTLKRRA